MLISNMSDHLPHFTCLSTKTHKYITEEKQVSLLSFYNEIGISIKNFNFPNELTADQNMAYNLVEKIT